MQTPHFSIHEWRALCAFYGQICLNCGVATLLVPDHIQPTALGGPDTIDNIQPLCQPCNARKWINSIDYRDPARVPAFLAALAAGYAGGFTLAEQQFAARFWDRVDRSGGPDACWPWLGAKKAGKYGAFGLNRRQHAAHHFAYELQHGPLAPGAVVYHDRIGIPCCNPSHLLVGTAGDVNRMTVRKGTHNPWPGTRAGQHLGSVAGGRAAGRKRARLTYAQAEEIRRLYERGDTTYWRLADQFGVAKTTVRAIVLGLTYTADE